MRGAVMTNSTLGARRAGLAAEFASLHRALRRTVRETRLTAARERLTQLGCTVLPGCDGAAITAWMCPGAPITLAATDATARALDDIQRITGEGPGRDASDDPACVPVAIADIAADRRWPGFTAGVASATAVRAVLVCRLPGSAGWCTMTFHAGAPAVFDDEAVQLAAFFATHAAICLKFAERMQHGVSE